MPGNTKAAEGLTVGARPPPSTAVARKQTARGGKKTKEIPVVPKEEQSTQTEPKIQVDAVPKPTKGRKRKAEPVGDTSAKENKQEADPVGDTSAIPTQEPADGLAKGRKRKAESNGNEKTAKRAKIDATESANDVSKKSNLVQLDNIVLPQNDEDKERGLKWMLVPYKLSKKRRQSVKNKKNGPSKQDVYECALKQYETRLRSLKREDFEELNDSYISDFNPTQGLQPHYGTILMNVVKDYGITVKGLVSENKVKGEYAEPVLDGVPRNVATVVYVGKRKNFTNHQESPYCMTREDFARARSALVI